jgi:hypothetical protein
MASMEGRSNCTYHERGLIDGGNCCAPTIIIAHHRASPRITAP